MRGRKPLPSHLKLITGNRGKRPVRKDVEVVPALKCDHCMGRFVGQIKELVQCPGKDI